MSVSAISAVMALPVTTIYEFISASATGIVNVGDWLQYSGQFVLPGFSGQGSTAYWKMSGAGVATDSNPKIDQAGRSVQNSAMIIVREGILHVSASFSGQVNLGIGAYPDATGSGVASPTGLSGLGATWNTAVPVSNSADPTAAAAKAPVATVIGSLNFSNAGTGELMLHLAPIRPDIR